MSPIEHPILRNSKDTRAATAEGLLSLLLQESQENLELKYRLVLEQACQAAHAMMRLRTKGGCFPITATFTHGSGSSRKARVPLNICLTSKILPAASRLAQTAGQELVSQEYAKTTTLTNLATIKLFQEQDVLWFHTSESKDIGHLFGALRLDDNILWAILDTDRIGLPPHLGYIFGFCGIDDVLLRAVFHHTYTADPITVYGFKSK